jgi:hypothetical protein
LKPLPDVCGVGGADVEYTPIFWCKTPSASAAGAKVINFLAANQLHFARGKPLKLKYRVWVGFNIDSSVRGRNDCEEERIGNALDTDVAHVA